MARRRLAGRAFRARLQAGLVRLQARLVRLRRWLATHAWTVATVVLAFTALGSLAAGLLVGAWGSVCRDCPSIAQIYVWEPKQSTKIFDHDSKLIAELFEERRTPVEIETLPPLRQVRFRRGRGQALLQAPRLQPARLHPRRDRAGARDGDAPEPPGGRRQHHHAAVGATHVRAADRVRAPADPQAEGAEGRAGHRGRLQQGRDPRSVHQPGELRPRLAGHRDRIAALFRQAGDRAGSRRGSHAGRRHQCARPLLAVPSIRSSRGSAATWCSG